MQVWEKWRPWLQQEKQLLLELALMLLVGLVVGVYFLEHFSTRLQAEQRSQLKALAQQTAYRSAESLAGDDSIGLNVIARETRALESVGGVAFQDLSQEPVIDNRNQDLPVNVEVPVALPDGELAGSVVLSAAHDNAPRQRLEAGYVLVVLGLLALRAAAEVIRRRLWRPQTSASSPTAVSDEASSPAPLNASQESTAQPLQEAPAVSVELRISVVNFGHFQERYTRSALQALLADYHHLLREVVALYGGELIRGIGDQARIRFTREPLSHSAFSALCAGLLFLRVVRLQAPRRKADQLPALEFKALVSEQFNAADSWSLCLAGVPGRLTVPETELTRAELDVKALYQTERAQLVDADDRQIRLQPVEQLAYRYQALLRTQAEKVLESTGTSSHDASAPSE